MEIIDLGNYNGTELFRLSNSKGAYVEIMTYGARIHRLCVPDKNGMLQDIVAGFSSPEEYRKENPYFNAIIGRVANRIGGAAFFLKGKEYRLYANDGNNSLHGGREGFDRKQFTAKCIYGKAPALELSYISADGEEGYPSKLSVTVRYSFDERNALTISYSAISDGTTLCNLTNHAYFNLNGDFGIPITNHILYLAASRVTQVDKQLIPTGKLPNVTDTPYDFRTAKPIGRDIGIPDEMLQIAGGYDFNYVLDKGTPAAWAYSPHSGISLEVYTDRPCMQLYSGNFLDGLQGKQVYNKHSAFCLETQGYPCACNIPTFPTTELSAGEEFRSQTVYLFGVRQS